MGRGCTRDVGGLAFGCLDLGGESVDTKSATGKLIPSPSSPASRVRTRMMLERQREGEG